MAKPTDAEVEREVTQFADLLIASGYEGPTINVEQLKDDAKKFLSIIEIMATMSPVGIDAVISWLNTEYDEFEEPFIGTAGPRQ